MSGPVYAFFDFDGTLIEGDSILYWLRFYYRRRPGRRVFQIANWAGLALKLVHVISSHTLKRVFLWPMSFEPPESLDALAADFIREDIAFRFHQLVLERLREHHRQGHNVVVISASASFYLRHIQSQLPPSCLILGTELEWNGGFLGLPVYRGGNLRGENKIRRLNEIGLGGAGLGGYAYSDHTHDVPLLRFVEFPVCVRPVRKLRRLAEASGWPIWDWPRERPSWRLRLESLRLLLFAV
jgi:HAD superfamily phosphoserine phosphatase-like hydrolase